MAKAVLTFTVYQGEEVLQQPTLDQDVIKIGQDPKSHLVLSDGEGARMHAVVEVAGPEDITLIDLGNEPGTSVNGAPINKCQLHVGDQILIGNTKIVLEKAEAPAVEPEAVPTPASNPFAAAGSTPFAAGASTNPFAASSGFAASNPFASSPAAAAVPAATGDTITGGSYRMLRSGPSVPPEECELTHVPAVDVSVSWGSNTLYSSTLNPPRNFYVGEESGKNTACDFFLPSEVLGTTRMPVVVASGGSASVVIPAGAKGFIDIPKQGRVSIEDAASSATPCSELSGAQQLALAPGSTAQIELGDFTFRVSAGNAGKPVGAGFDPRGMMETLPYFLIAAFFIGGILLMGLYSAPPSNLEADEGVDRDTIAMMQEWLDPDALKELEEKETEQEAEEDADNKEGGTGTRAKGEEGQMGDENETDKDKAYAIQGDTEDPQIAKQRALREAQNFGMIGLLNANVSGDPAAPVAPWGADVAQGNQEISANGNMWGSEFGNAFGAGGLGLSGWGEGGGGMGEGIGLGNIGTIGHGAGTGSGMGIGSGHGRLRGSHRARAPKLRAGATTVSGRLPPEVIRRIVRQNHGRFRQCYEQGLGRNPNLEGRVAVRFIIGRDGAVSNVSNGGSDLPDSQVVSCVMRVYYRLSFPQPEGGIVTVVYPLNFQPN